MKIIKFFLFFLILNTYYLILDTDCLAQAFLGISAIPPRLEISVEPGKTITKEIKVRNESPVEKIISTKVKDFVVVDDTGTPLQVESQGDSSNRWAASSWIQVSATSLKLKPGETKTLMVTVVAPDDALPGGHYAMILHSPQNETTLSQTGSLIETNVGTLVYVTIPGDIKESALIKDFSAPRFSEYGPIDFKATVTNLSDIHITPAGRIAVTNSLGFNAATLPLESVNIFPYTSREYLSTLDRKLMLGRFRAQFMATYGTTGQLVNATLFFWVIPWRLLLTITAILIIIIAIIKLNYKRAIEKSPDSPKVEQLEKELTALKKKYQDRK
ncbi:MAG: hypothetical protein AAB574_03540 [Patescibacteria group bacterium]